MKISVIGNGFDLRHDLATGFNDYLKSYKEHCNENLAPKNIIASYFEKVSSSNGWLDFEEELKEFLVYTERLDASIEYNNSRKKRIININKFVSSNNSFLYYENLKEMNYSFFGTYGSRSQYDKNPQPYNSIVIEDDCWLKSLIEEVNNDFARLRDYLKKYLLKVTYDRDNEIQMFDTSEIDVLMKSDKIISFNYTKTFEQYGHYRVDYAHGSLDDEIILGIPYTSEIQRKEFSHYFKTNQTIDYDYNKSIIEANSLSQKIEIYLIGFSFGKSDHYYFNDIIDHIQEYEAVYTTGIPDIYFNIFIRKDSNKSNYINNLRAFLGEERLTRYSAAKRIKFVEYGTNIKEI